MSNELASDCAKNSFMQNGDFFLTASAVVALATVGFIIRLFGFKTLHFLVKRLPTSQKKRTVTAEYIVDGVRRALDSAVSYRVTPAMCLRRAGAAVCLLRLRGVPSTLVIGVQRLPFAAHAWAEVDGRVVTESHDWKNTYRVIERF
jgi:Transglutaminase-like superfamily